MQKENVVYVYNEMLFSGEKDKILTFAGKWWRMSVEWSKLGLERPILQIFPYMRELICK